MKRKWFAKGLILAAALLMGRPCWAAHPLVTDDTGTQGKGKFQFKLNGQYGWDKENNEGISVKSTGCQAAGTLSYGIVENVDLVLSVPYLWEKEKDNDVTVYDEKRNRRCDTGSKVEVIRENGFSVARNRESAFPPAIMTGGWVPERSVAIFF